MRVDKTNLRTLETSFKALFQKAFDGTEAFSDRIATKTSSGTAEELYAWLGQFPRLREWIGSRVINNLVAHGYSIKNKLFESTITIPRTSIEDDQYGIHAPMASEMGRAAKEHPDELLFHLLASGFTERGYYGKPFFSEAHPVTAVPGTSKVHGDIEHASGQRRCMVPPGHHTRHPPADLAGAHWPIVHVSHQ
ncbi:phage major head subunit gpT-like protein [Pseudochelatococcus lubricantis]|uniref:Phage major head subunit gpT-like protein n=1 Tax=Pseudochelatococcus lubricantis TaxID=1538102 RepID=A0ABX0VA74_9HYPH|nr:Mu-like prophage major head subunit gpT family protein [Pseudochelatococcus lubricantis]NIJ60081.1 phage major head subunit gpT-like protein [Pseudochelatococcus lubricantis]